MVRGGLLVVAAVALSGCWSPRVEEFSPGTYTRGELFGLRTDSPDQPVDPPEELRAEVTRLVSAAYPHPIALGLSDPARRRLMSGYRLYQQHCLQCHGMSGAGDGVLGTTISPRPRDFRRGVFKWKSTDRSAKPIIDDLVTTLVRGIPGTAMQPFARLDRNDLVLMVEFVVYLSKRGEFERRLLTGYATEGPSQQELDATKETLTDAEVNEYRAFLAELANEEKTSIEETWFLANDRVVVPTNPDPAPTEGSPDWGQMVARGRAVFAGPEAGCVKCHGVDGTGENNLSPDQMTDDCGLPNPPRDLTIGIFRGGGEGIHLYRRVREGIAGTVMPGLSGTLALDEDTIWDLVYFVQSMSKEPKVAAQ